MLQFTAKVDGGFAVFWGERLKVGDWDDPHVRLDGKARRTVDPEAKRG